MDMTTDKTLDAVADLDSADRLSLPGKVVLVMQGGGAPGAYQGGVYQALHEAGIEPDWVVGTSIGAINGAIIVGNNPAMRLERLKEFWSRIELRPPPPWNIFAAPFGSLMSDFTTLLNGVPGFFAPNPASIWGPQAPVGVEQAAIYSVNPLKELLPTLVDFELINGGKPRFTLGLVSVRSGQMRYFDSKNEKIGLEHVLGSSAIPPSFPAVRIDGEAYWDGGIYSNTPVEVVFEENPRKDSVVFAVQLWHTHGPEPESLAQAFTRQKDILFGSRSRHNIAEQARLHRMRHVIRELVQMLPEDQKNTPKAKELAGWGCTSVMHLIEINARALDGETNSRDFDFSPASIYARWQAGYADANRVIEQRPWEQPVDPMIGVGLYVSDAAEPT